MDTVIGFKHLIKAFEPKASMACATSTMREAKNGSRLCASISEQTGVQIEIVDGKREAGIE